MQALLCVAVAIALVSGMASAEPPSQPIGSFSTAKKVARDDIYVDHRKTLYCNCDYTPTQTSSGGQIDQTACGYTPRANANRGKRLEWEHVVPAWYFGRTRKCWSR